MTDLRDRIKNGWDDQLRGILDSSRKAGAQGVLVFDLDSTVFDNRPRQARIVRETLDIVSGLRTAGAT